jgi:DNA-binding IclR family transcriptional regulator
MPTAVPALDRAVAILTLLRNRPLESFSLSDFSRETGIHKATCAAILRTMESHGLVSRSSNLRYTLGPALVGLAQAYRDRFQPFIVGRPEIWRLAERVHLSCSATVLDGDDMVVLDIYGDTQPSHLPMRIGTRLQMAPPLGSVFTAWRDPEAVSKWLDEIETLFEGDRINHLTSLATVRARGFALGVEQDFHVEFAAVLREAAKAETQDQGAVWVATMIADKMRNIQMSGATPDTEDEPVNYLVAPVFGRDSQVVMSVNMFGQFGEIRRRDIDRIGEELLKTTSRITHRIGGVFPPGYRAG